MMSGIETLDRAADASRPTIRPSLGRLLESVFLWITLARSRRHLAALDDRALHDIGLDRATAIEDLGSGIVLPHHTHLALSTDSG